MNSYQLISKLRKVRDDTYLTAIDQALYYELISICNEKGWKEVFEARSAVLCTSLNIWDKTLRKSRKALADAGLIFFKSCRDKRIGCYYSFLPILDNDMKSSVISSVNGTDENTEENTDDIPTEECQSSVNYTVISSVLRTDENTDDKNASSVISSVNGTDDMQIPPIIDIKTINIESNLAHTHESTPPTKPKRSKKKEGDEKPLVYPFTSIAFMSAWEALRQTPKWKKKLNYALQLSLDKLSKFEEEFAILQIERAIESGWTGVVFTGTERDYQEWLNQKYGNNRKSCTNKHEANIYAMQQYLAERQRREQGLADEVEKPF
ncbi:hypothetical protein [Bacteroides salyersiae]|uniref:hypothetical protein n=1 Tax=Bacteroides salyersiae TaxID=291644 RepID=UPI000326F445|nr:hypothetical protein [Bacteroides salyersiae]EOA48946.1 hypothetical protein HMPREF1532_02580 [Bacteroides salyersiae WAL 10018 = DSM 18765 = JCM 12988]